MSLDHKPDMELIAGAFSSAHLCISTSVGSHFPPYTLGAELQFHMDEATVKGGLCTWRGVQSAHHVLTFEYAFLIVYQFIPVLMTCK